MAREVGLPEPRDCSNCGTPPRGYHSSFCDVARCAITGGQRNSCGAFDSEGWPPDHDCGDLVWSGIWPGVEECEEFGWYAFFAPDWIQGGIGFVTCDRDHPGARHDLNRLYVDAVWDRAVGRFRKRES